MGLCQIWPWRGEDGKYRGLQNLRTLSECQHFTIFSPHYGDIIYWSSWNFEQNTNFVVACPFSFLPSSFLPSRVSFPVPFHLPFSFSFFPASLLPFFTCSLHPVHFPVFASSFFPVSPLASFSCSISLHPISSYYSSFSPFLSFLASSPSRCGENGMLPLPVLQWFGDVYVL